MENEVMFKIETTLNQLTQALQKNQPVSGWGHGYWYTEGIFQRTLRRFWGGADSRWSSLAKSFNSRLDALEALPVVYATGDPQLQIDQAVDFQSYKKIAELILSNLSFCTSKEAVHARNSLKRRYVALLYRLEAVNGGLDAVDVCKNYSEELLELASQWKHQQSILYDKALSIKERQRLMETLCFPEFVKLLFADEELKSEFLLWIIRDKVSPSPFIQFPAMQQKISDSTMTGRIGHFGENSLCIKKKLSNTEKFLSKVLTLPFEGKEMNILNESLSYTFHGNYTLTIKKIFECFKNKNIHIGNLEFLAEGISNWNNHRLGSWDADRKAYNIIDMSQPKWWSQLPIFEILSKQEAQRKYGWHLDGKTWNAAATASRGTPSLDFEHTHAYLELAIPFPDGKRYAIYDFGKFADEFPGSPIETLSMLCRNVHATIAYPDENVFYTHRQHAYHSFCMSPEEGIQLMDYIKHDILRSREKNFVYQIESENCAKWSQELLEAVLGGHRVPNLFKMPLLKTEPMGPVAKIFDLIKKLPVNFQTKVLTFLHLPLGAAKGTWIVENGKKVRKSLMTHEFWDTAEVYLPAFLHKQKEIGVFEPAVEAVVLPIGNGYFSPYKKVREEYFADKKWNRFTQQLQSSILLMHRNLNLTVSSLSDCNVLKFAFMRVGRNRF